jgi:hypothetical protein
VIDYCGAGARLEIDRARKLDPRRWAFMPKLDGCYARVALGDAGQIVSVTSRSGCVLREADDLIGVVAGAPSSVLHGELEAHTEAGIAAARDRGWRALHLFDVTVADGRDLSSVPYTDRYGALHAMQALIEQRGDGRVEPMVLDRTGRRHDEAGRFSPFTPRDLRRLPIVALHRGAGAAEQLWTDHVERNNGEGIVAVRLDAPVSARGAKRKVKQSDTIDVVVMRFDARVAEVAHGGKSFLVSCSGLELAPGQVVEVKHDGAYASGEPRFARIVRQRRDLAPTFN